MNLEDYALQENDFIYVKVKPDEWNMFMSGYRIAYPKDDLGNLIPSQWADGGAFRFIRKIKLNNNKDHFLFNGFWSISKDLTALYIEVDFFKMLLCNKIITVMGR